MDVPSNRCPTSMVPSKIDTSCNIPIIKPLSTSPTPQFTEDGLILPRKLINPFCDSKEKKNLQRELLFNSKIGKNVLDQKSELEKVMAKRAKDARAKEKQVEEKEKSNSLERKSSFEKKLAEQAAKLAKSTLNDDNNLANSESKFGNVPEGQAEFLKIHAKIKSHSNNQTLASNVSTSSAAAKDPSSDVSSVVCQENIKPSSNNNNPKGL